MHTENSLQTVSINLSSNGCAASDTSMTRFRDTPVIVVALRGHRALTHSPTHTKFCCLRRSHLTLLVVDRSMVLEPTGLVDMRPTCPTEWQILLADLLVDSRPLCVSFPLCPVLPRPLLLSHSSHHLFALLELTLLHAASSFCLRCRTMATASSSFVSMSTHRRRI